MVMKSTNSVSQYLVRYSRRHSASIDHFHSDFASIWARDQDDRTVFDLWLHVVDHAARVARAVRLDEPANVMDDLADTTVWTMSFLAQCQSSQNPLDVYFRIPYSLSDLLWNKYPGICPSCFDARIIEAAAEANALDSESSPQTEFEDALHQISDTFDEPTPCTCLATLAENKNLTTLRKRFRGELDHVRREYADILRSSGRKTENISDLENMFSDIFSTTHRVFSLQVIASHLLEEVGDVTQALKDCYTFDHTREPYTTDLQQKRLTQLGEQAADLFSWLFAMAAKVGSVYYSDAAKYGRIVGDRLNPAGIAHALRFSDIIWAKYGTAPGGGLWDNLRCPGCSDAPCSCPRDLKIAWGGGIRLAPTPDQELQSGVEPSPAPAVSALNATPLVIVSPQFWISQEASSRPYITTDLKQESTQEGVSALGDINMPKGVSVGVGRNASGTVTEINQLWAEAGVSKIDLESLATELTTLRAAIREKGDSVEHDLALAEIAKAETAARSQDGPAALKHLRAAGKWTLEIATEIGAHVAAAAIGVALGLHA